MASKFDQFLKASWNAIFSTKRRQDARRSPVLESAWRNARVAWGGLRRGKTDVQTPRTFESGTWSKEIGLEGQEDVDSTIQHAVPGWAADRFAHSAGPYIEIWSHTILIFRDPGTQIIDF